MQGPVLSRLGRLRRARAHLRVRLSAGDSRGRRDEGGFILLESIVAVSLITVILAALGTFTLRSITSTNDLRARQSASQIATSTIAALGSIPATDLLTGRDATSVANQFAAAPAAVQPALATMTHNASDPSAANGAGAEEV